jgi:fructosamine-3-kinase
MTADALIEMITGAPPRAAQGLGGGCIHDVRLVMLDDGRDVVVKSNRPDMLAAFEAEAADLRAIRATDTVPAPEPLGVQADDHVAVLCLEYLEPTRADDGAWERFASALAAMHNADAGVRYGFPSDNFIGATPQRNDWSNDWVDFNATHRIGYQCRLARDAGLLSASDMAACDRLIGRLDRLIPRAPRPSLLHGDLWGGNAHACRQGIAVLDPACSIGDALADIAMMELFGGFPALVFERHAALVAGSADNRRERLAVYRLYHVLNHLNLFGAGYHGQAMSIARALG